MGNSGERRIWNVGAQDIGQGEDALGASIIKDERAQAGAE